MINIARLVNEDDWYEMVESHPTHDINTYVTCALELRRYELRVEHDHSVWISLAPSLDGRLLGPIRHMHRRQLMVWYEIHVASRIPV